MNVKLGLISSYLMILTIFIFAITLISGNAWLSYFSSMIFSWGYVLFLCSLYDEIKKERKSVFFGGMAFSIMYATIISVVYFTQISTVANNAGPENVISVLDYSNIGSLFFNIDLLGYGLLSFSTFLVGVAIISVSKVDKYLKGLLIFHGIFLFPLILLPVFDVFNNIDEGSEVFGVLSLLFWCIYFIFIAILALVHFNKKHNKRVIFI